MRGSSGAGRGSPALLLAGGLMLLAVTACASSGGEPEQTAFRGGVVALQDARYQQAWERLERVRRACGTSPLAQQAVLLEAAGALAGGPGDRDPDRAARFAAAYLQQPRPPEWGVPVAEAVFLMAREMGAAVPTPEETAGVFVSGPDEEQAGQGEPAVWCEADWATRRGERAAEPRALPELEGPSVARDRERLVHRIRALEDEVERLRELLELPE